MLDRRTFMSGSVGALGVAFMAWPVRAHVDATPRRGPALGIDAPSIAVVDRHVAGSERFAAKVRARGLEPLEFDSDVATLWMRELEPRLGVGAIAIAGCTSAATLFCLELLARDYGARIVERVEARGAAMWVIASSPMGRAALAPRPLRSRWSESHA